jgi:small subunit ribosomal protein S3
VKVWIYRGEAAQTRAEREAAAAALRAGQRSGRDRDRPPQRGRRRPGGPGGSGGAGGPDWTGAGSGPDRGDARGQEGRDQAVTAGPAGAGAPGTTGAGEEG